MASLWSSVVQHFEGNEAVLVFGGTFSLVITTFWAYGLAHFVLDFLQKPDFLYKFKIQKNKSLPVELVPRLFFTLYVQQFAIMMPGAYALYWFDTFRLDPVLPSVGEVVRDMAVFVLAEEVMFFYVHWLLHTPFLYKNIHKVHHQFRSPIALAASYAHPVEFIVGNVLPLVVTPVVLNSHILTAWLWFMVAVIGTQTHHCGYRFPWTLPFDHQPDFHDWHHETFCGNYGLLGFLDRLHGTDAQYRKHLRGRKVGFDGSKES